MIYDVVENVMPVLEAHVVADLVALAQQKGVDVESALHFYPRESADVFVELRQPLPGLGVYVVKTTTQAQSQGTRDNTHTVVFDGAWTGEDPVSVRRWAELLAEALCRSIDRLYQAGGGVYGAGELEGSIAIDLLPLAQPAGQGTYEQRVLVTFPLNEEDTGLS